MFLIFVILSYVSLIESYKITGHAQLKARGDEMINFLKEHVKEIHWNADNIRKLWNLVRSGEVEITNEPVDDDASNELMKPNERVSKKDLLSSHYPSNYPKLAAFKMADLIGNDNDKRRFLDFIKEIDPVYKILLSELNVEYLQKHGKQYPKSMIAHDFIQLAEHFNIRIQSNGDKTYNIDWDRLQKRG